MMIYYVKIEVIIYYVFAHNTQTKACKRAYIAIRSILGVLCLLLFRLESLGKKRVNLCIKIVK